MKENNIKEICNKLNDLRNEYNPYGDKSNVNNIKEQVINLLNSIPVGTELGQVFKETHSYYTSHGGHLDEYTEAHKYVKLDDKMWSSRYSKKKDVNDMVLSVLYNSTDIMPYDEAVNIANNKKINDKSHFTSYAIPEAGILTQNSTTYRNSSARDKFIDQVNLIEDFFYDFMINKGYSVNIYDEEEVQDMGYGGWATKEDKFAIFFKLVEFSYPRTFSIHAEDRNGNQILYGDTVAIYSVSGNDNLSNEELLDKFKMALNDIYEKYKGYSKENRLDFVFNNLEMERKDYTNNQTKNDIELDEIEKE